MNFLGTIFMSHLMETYSNYVDVTLMHESQVITDSFEVVQLRAP